MVIWKERENDMADFQAVSDPATVEDLLNCGMLKYFRVPCMKAYIHLLEYIVDMWDPEEKQFVVGTHALNIDIKIYNS